MIKLKNYTINNQSITNELLINYINNFWIEIFNEIKDTSHLLLLSKVQLSEEENGYRTLGHLVKVNFEDKEFFIDYLSQRLSILNESYMTHPISNIIFSYLIKPGKIMDKDRAILQDINKPTTFHSFNKFKLPISMNPSDYGEIQAKQIIELEGISYHRSILYNCSKIFRIYRSINGFTNKVKILGNINLDWIDSLIKEESNFFMREIKKSTIY